MVIAWHAKLKSRLDFEQENEVFLQRSYFLTDGNPTLGSFLVPETSATIITIINKK